MGAAGRPYPGSVEHAVALAELNARLYQGTFLCSLRALRRISEHNLAAAQGLTELLDEQRESFLVHDQATFSVMDRCS